MFHNMYMGIYALIIKFQTCTRKNVGLSYLLTRSEPMVEYRERCKGRPAKKIAIIDIDEMDWKMTFFDEGKH